MMDKREHRNLETDKARRTFQDLCLCFPELTISLTYSDAPEVHIQDEFGQKFSLPIDIIEETQKILQELIFSIKYQLKKYDA
jgi:hypothetical protein